MDEEDLARMLGLTRAAIGAACLFLPRRMTRLWTGEPHAASTAMALRGLGGRDLALGLCLLRALEDEGHIARWLEAGAVADASDTLAALANSDLPPARRLLFLLAAGGAAGLGLYLAANIED
jgi:hypothetical protein